MLKSLELENFRSYDRRRLDVDSELVLVVGPNASGKTNLLESIYVLSATKSFRAKDRDLIRHGQNYFRIVVEDGDRQLSLGFSTEDGRSQKKINHDGAPQTLGRHVGSLPVTLFEPTDLDLIGGPPEQRRRYLDFILCQTEAAYLSALNGYRKILKQRNRLLENFAVDQIKDQIFVWDLKLSEQAAAIFEGRRKLIDYLNNLINHRYQEIAGQPAKFELVYLPTVPGSDYGSNFLAALGQNLPRDLAAGFTTIGPHREDFKVNFQNSDMTAIASRGEIRTAVLALKLAELDYMEQKGRKPLLLLDDVFSELDRSRRQYLVQQLAGYQTIITTTDADAITPDIKSEFQLIETGVKA